MDNVAGGYRYFLLFLVLFLNLDGLVSSSVRQEKEEDAWEWPLKIINGFSSNFGEYRSNHFHAGLDLRTFQKNGFPVYAVADGVVEVIRKDWQGTGLGVVIRHDNGYRSFTYHLDALREDLQKILEDHVKTMGNRYPGNIEMKKIIRLGKGEIYAYSGESGSGFPHLHIEIRTAQGTAVNPLNVLNSPMKDLQPPVMHSLMVRARESALINHEFREWEGRLTIRENGVYGLEESLTLDGPTDWIVVGKDVSDSGRPVAPYKLRFSLDGVQLLSVVFDELTREYNPQVGLVYDRQHSAMGRYAYTLFAQPGNSVYGLETEKYESIWTRMSAGVHEAIIEMEDHAGNRVRAEIPFHYLPHQAVGVELVSMAERLFTLKGPSEIAPATLVVKTMDSGNRPLFIGELPMNSLTSPEKFALSELSESVACIEFHLMRGERRIWFDRLYLPGRLLELSPGEPLWRINRGLVSLEIPMGQDCTPLIHCDGNRIHPSNHRQALGRVFHLFQPNGTSDAVISGKEDSGGTRFLTLHPGAVSRWQGQGYSLAFDSGSVHMDRLMKIDSAADAEAAEYPVCSQPIALSPAHLPLAKAMDVSLEIEAQKNPEQLGFFICPEGGGRWRYLATQSRGNGRFTARLWILGVKLALMRDVFPPRLMKGRLDRSRGKRRFLIGAADKGKGIDYRNVSVRCASRELPAEYDPDRSRIDVPLDVLPAGRHTLFVRIRDYAGHQSSRKYTVLIN